MYIFLGHTEITVALKEHCILQKCQHAFLMKQCLSDGDSDATRLHCEVRRRAQESLWVLVAPRSLQHISDCQ